VQLFLDKTTINAVVLNERTRLDSKQGRKTITWCLSGFYRVNITSLRKETRTHVSVSFCPHSVTSSNMVCVVMFLLLGYLAQPEYVFSHVGGILAYRARIAGYILSCCSLPLQSATDSLNANDYESVRVR